MAKIIKDPKKRRNVRRSVRTLKEAALETLAYFRDKILGCVCQAIGFMQYFADKIAGKELSSQFWTGFFIIVAFSLMYFDVILAFFILGCRILWLLERSL
jgi:hypothetical protein|tara:strand:- start:482 stop:781 length:300 start_codon:yes stop_codon:yes gene_type:complete